MGIGTADVFLDGAVMDAIRNPLCICNRGFITEVMQHGIMVLFHENDWHSWVNRPKNSATRY